MNKPLLALAAVGLGLAATGAGLQTIRNKQVIAMLQQAGPCPPLSRAAFLQRLEQAVAIAKQKGAILNKQAVMAQAALESAWGSRIPEANGVCSNNLFGIKAGLTWTGPTVVTQTSEYLNGRWVRTQARWRAYPSWNECLVDYSRIIRTLYPQCLPYAEGDPAGWVRGLVSGKVWRWATDPNYVTVVQAVGQSLASYGGPQWA